MPFLVLHGANFISKKTTNVTNLMRLEHQTQEAAAASRPIANRKLIEKHKGVMEDQLAQVWALSKDDHDKPLCI